MRILPTPEQEILLNQHIDTCRWVWNYMLAEHERFYKETNQHLSGYSMMKILSDLKRTDEFHWLTQVSAFSLNRICRDLDFAFQQFFQKNCGYPKFKSKKTAKRTFPVRDSNNTVYFNTDDTVHIERIGMIKCRMSKYVPYGRDIKIMNPRISVQNNKWILTIVIGCENQAVNLSTVPMGIDLGVKDLATVAYGNNITKIPNINKTIRVKNLERKINHIRRVINRKKRRKESQNKPDSNRIIKYRRMLKRCYSKLTNIRKDYIHKITSMLVYTLKPSTIIMEDLNIYGMMMNKRLSKSIQDQNWGLFIRCMKYKAESIGSTFILADRFYPSSRTCSSCGTINTNLKLRDRIFKCPNCGIVIDRDVNAAVNLRNYLVTS